MDSDQLRLSDAGFLRPPRLSSTKPSGAVHRQTTRTTEDIAQFNHRRTLYSKRDLPRRLECAPKGGRLLCCLEEKFASWGFKWTPVLCFEGGFKTEFGHNADGYATLTSENAKAFNGEIGDVITVELNPVERTAELVPIAVSKNGTVTRGKAIFMVRGVISIDIVCKNKPTFNGDDVTFEDMFHQKVSIFDPPGITRAN